jgi:ABC-type multidrug transport system permease subunit
VTAVIQQVRDFVQFLVELPGHIWHGLCALGTVLFILAVWAGLIALLLYGLFELFLSPPTPPRVLTTSDLWWVVALACFIGSMSGDKK